MLCLNHNVESVSAHLMGERSPIIDIEHTYLYSPTTMRRIFRAAGLRIREQGRVNNTYSVSYVTHLTPIPARAKALALGTLNRSRVGQDFASRSPRQSVPHRRATVGAAGFPYRFAATASSGCAASQSAVRIIPSDTAVVACQPSSDWMSVGSPTQTCVSQAASRSHPTRVQR